MISTHQKRVIIVGAGVGGRETYRALEKSAGDYKVVGFVDDSVRQVSVGEKDIRVVGKISDIPTVITKHNVNEILIAIPSAEGGLMRRIIDHCTAANIRFRIIPRTLDLIEGRVQLSHIRDVRPEDLIGRALRKTDQRPLRTFIRGKRVLVTGAAGSIGSEICRQVIEYGPAELIALDWWENGLYDLELALREQQPAVPLHIAVANIQDKNAIDPVIRRHRPELVFHAAAYKHVPMMERAPHEAIKNNIIGTWRVATAALRAGAKKFILISTDKAVKPTSVMGVTKRLAELLTNSLNQSGRTKFAAVRFGNVFASRGSVVPLFQSQIAKGGPVTVTHPDMTRYFMSIAEAVQLVLQASNESRGNEVFVLDMGEPVKILELARNMIRLSGYEPEKGIPIVFSGVRPGEKIFEEILTDQEDTVATKMRNIFIAKNETGTKVQASTIVKRLETLARTGTPAEIRTYLKRVVPTYHPHHG